MGRRALVDIGDAAGTDEGEADAIEDVNREDEERGAVDSDQDEPEDAKDESENDHATGTDAALHALGEVIAGDLTRDGEGGCQAHEGGAAPDAADVEEKEIDHGGIA